jgi:hypothetical protein
MGITAHSDFISHGVEHLENPQNCKEIAKSLLKKGQVKIIGIPNFPNNTLTVEPSNKQFQKELKAFAKEHKNHKITQSEEKAIVGAFLEQITKEQASYKAGGKDKKGLFIAEGIACLRDPKNVDRILESLITKRRVKISDVPGFPNKTLTIRPSNKQFRKQLKALDKAHTKPPLTEKEKAYLLKILFEELKEKKAELNTQKTGKMKKYYAAAGVNSERLKKKAEKHKVKELDSEMQKQISAQVSLALDEINKKIELLEQKSGIIIKDNVISKERSTDDNATKPPGFESKTVRLFKATSQKEQRIEREKLELAEEAETHSAQDKKKQKEAEATLKNDVIIKTDAMRQIIRRESLKNSPSAQHGELTANPKNKP